MAQYTPLSPRRPRRRDDWRPWAGVGVLIWILAMSLTGSWNLRPPGRDPRTTAVLAAQYHALLRLRDPSLSEMANPLTADVQAVSPGVYEVRSWVAGSDRLGYPRRQAFTARVACPEGTRRFEEWQLVDFRFE